MYKLRKYQEDAVEAGVKNLLTSDKNGILILPSGSGKSLVVAGIAQALDGPVLVLQPSVEILEQNYSKLTSYGITDCGIYSASANEKTIGRFTFATIGSVYRKPELFKHFKYVIFDEAHSHSVKKSGMYNKFFKAIGNPRVIGLTATPFKNVPKFLKKNANWCKYTSWCTMINRIPPFFFKQILYKISHQDLLDKGYLCPFEYKYKDEGFDLSSLKVNSTGAEYTTESIEEYLNLPTNITKVISAVAEEINSSKHILVFASSLTHAENVKDALERVYNIKADTLPGDTPKKQREALLKDFTSGKLRVVINVGTMTTGWDFPELDCIVLGRATMSLNLYYQMICRGCRIAPGKMKCVVVDCCKNVKRLGRVETLHITKEADGFRDKVTTEAGDISSKPLFTYAMKLHDWSKKKVETSTT